MQRLVDLIPPAFRGTPTVLAWTLAAVVAAGWCGCGKSVGPTGSVQGKVVLDTAPVTEGNVQFCRKDGVPVDVAKLDASGQFKFDQPVPVGEYQVAILAGGDAPAGAGGPEAKQEPPKIPPKYQDSFKSELKATVAEGENTFTFELKP